MLKLDFIKTSIYFTFKKFAHRTVCHLRFLPIPVKHVENVNELMLLADIFLKVK